MRNLIVSSAILLTLFLSPAGLRGQAAVLVGGRGLPHLNTAWILPRGQMTLHGFASSYYQTVVVKRPDQLPSTTTFWDVRGALGLHYASGKHLEWALTQMVYQDTHRGKGYNLPDDLYFTMKFGSYGSKVSPLKVGFLAAGRFPLGNNYNIPFEPYSSGRVELGVTGIVSYSPDLLLPENAFNLHLNVGYWHHNDVGRLLTGSPEDTVAVLNPSRDFLWGLGFAIPTYQFDFTFELFGRVYVVRPPETAYSREDFVYFSPGVSYRPRYWLSVNVGFDIRLSPDNDLTRYGPTLSRINESLPSYPDWRVNFGAKIHLNRTPPPGNKPLFVSSNGRLVPRQKSLEKQLHLEQQKTETAEEELNNIRSERMRMETMLARLRKLLFDGKTGDEKATEKNQADSKNPEGGQDKKNQ